MPPDTTVIDPPAPTPPAATPADTPPKKVSMADKFRAEMDRQSKEPTPGSETPPSPTPPAVTLTSTSPIDIALGEAKPAAPAPTPVEEDFDKIETPKADDWSRARAAIKGLRTELGTVKAAPKVDPALNGQLTEAQKKIEELTGTIADRDARIKAINAEYSPEYQSIVKERSDAINKAVSRLESFGGKEKADQLLDALSMRPGKMRNTAVKEAMADLDTDEKTRVYDQIEKIESAEEKIEDFRKDLPSQWDDIQKRHDEAIRVETEKSLKELDSNFESITAKIPESNVFLRQIPDDVPESSAWNGNIKSAIANAKRIITPGTGATLPESVVVLVKGSHYDHVVAYALDIRKQLIAANARLADFDAAGPDFKGGKQAKPGDKKLSPAEKFHKYMAEHTEAVED